jgi:hypothetical protein
MGAWKKVLLFGLFGTVGCLAGWVVGEPYLAVSRYISGEVGAGQGPSLISSSVPPSSEPPPIPSEFRDRLEKAGAHTGDVQISLIWFNTNDLDLHCIDPRGFEISWQAANRRSPSGGELDVDRNAGCRAPTVEPVENIYWPKDGAPMGHYKVLLHYYQRCRAAPDETRYKINVLHGGERKEFTGTISFNDTRGEQRLIYEFELTPKVEVFVPPEFSVNRGTTVRLPVAVRRSFYSGELSLKAENLPEGVVAGTSSIESGKNEGSIQLKASDSAKTVDQLPIKIVATAREVSGSADPRIKVTSSVAFSMVETAIIGVWTALLALGLCLALLAGQNYYLGRPLTSRGRIPLAIVVMGAVLAGFVSGLVGQTLYSVLVSIGAGGLGFLVGWALLGGLLGLGVSYFVPNLDQRKAALAGLAGGLLGGIGYLIWSNASDWLGRFAGAAMLGFCIGLMVAIVEAAFRTFWLEVRFGERETIQVNLGPEPVKIGGDSRACTIWARGARDVAYRYFVRDGKVICEDASERRETVAGNGDTRTIGTVTVTVRTGTTAAPVVRTVVRPTMPAPLPPVPLPPAPLQPASVATGLNGTVTPAVKPQPLPPPPPAAPPTAVVAPPAPASVKPLTLDDDPLPIPVSPTPPARPKVASILDDGYSPPVVPAAPSQTKTSVPPVPSASASPPAVPPKPALPTARPPLAAAPSPPKPAVPPSAVSPPRPVVPPKPAVPPKPPAPAAAAPPAPIAPAPMAPPAPPRSPAPKEKAPPAADAKPTDADACPTCGRRSPGRPGARFCMMCDKTY